MTAQSPEQAIKPTRAPFGIALAIAAGCAAGAWLLRPAGGLPFGLCIGGLCGSVLFFLGWAGARSALTGSPSRMLRAVFGGMLIRLALAGGASAVVIGFELAHPAGFVAGLFAVTFAAMVCEVLFLSGHARRLRARVAPESNGAQA